MPSNRSAGHRHAGTHTARALLLAASLGLSACVTATLDVTDDGSQTAEQTAPPPAETRTAAPAPASGVSASATKCAIYYEIMTQLAVENRTSSRNVAEGCPPQTDTGVDLSPGSASAADSALAQAFRRKLIERGTPGDMADRVIRSRAFAQLAGRG